jgi:uncharacterized protein
MSGPLQRLSFITVGARNINGLADFYKGLGWELAAEASDGFTAFHCGGVMLALWPIENLSHEAAPGEPEPARG